MVVLVFFFFKQKTAYEMRISDWSSDVCSSDLHRQVGRHLQPARVRRPHSAVRRVHGADRIGRHRGRSAEAAPAQAQLPRPGRRARRHRHRFIRRPAARALRRAARERQGLAGPAHQRRHARPARAAAGQGGPDDRLRTLAARARRHHRRYRRPGRPPRAPDDRRQRPVHRAVRPTGHRCERRAQDACTRHARVLPPQPRPAGPRCRVDAGGRRGSGATGTFRATLSLGPSEPAPGRERRRRPIRPATQACADSGCRTWPSPRTTQRSMVSDSRPIGPYACRRVVEMPISAPRPNWPPSLKREEALTITAELRIARTKRSAAAWSVVEITSVWSEVWRWMWGEAVWIESNPRLAMIGARYQVSLFPYGAE